MTSASEKPGAAVMSKSLYVAYTNSDNTEGRGIDIPIAVCSRMSTAVRLARGRYVQGTDGPVRTIKAIYVDNEWYVLNQAVSIIEPSMEDLEEEERQEKKKILIAKAHAAGLTDEDIAQLQSL